MKNQPINERISDIFNQRHNYQRHLNKLGELTKRNTPNHTLRHDAMDRIRLRKQQTFYRTMANSQMKIKKENSLIYDKLSNCNRAVDRPGKSFSSDSRLPLDTIRRRSQAKTDRDNLQLYYKLNRLTPSIDNRKLQKDYQSSVSIRNRISRFEKSPHSQDSAVLKLNRYFQSSSRSIPSKPKKEAEDSFAFSSKGKISKDGKFSSTAQSKLSSKMDVVYNKEDIIKNKVSNKWSYLKRKRFHNNTKEPVPLEQAKGDKEVRDTVFPTEAPCCT